MEDSPSKTRQQVFCLPRFIACMGLALVIGVIVNLFFEAEDKPPFRFLELIPLVFYYIPFCLFFLALMMIWNRWFQDNIYAIWLLILISVLVLIVGFYMFPVGKYHGVHLILVSFLGFFLSSADQLVQRFKAASVTNIQE
jgi:amino acid transporter